MTEVQFQKLLEQNNAILFGQLTEHVDAQLEKNNQQLTERLDAQLEKNNAMLVAHVETLFEQNNAVLFGQFTKHFDKKFDSLRAELKYDIGIIQNLLDGIAKRLETDDQERAVIAVEQDRHRSWIGQLADHTHTKLVPEQ